MGADVINDAHLTMHVVQHVLLQGYENPGVKERFLLLARHMPTQLSLKPEPFDLHIGWMFPSHLQRSSFDFFVDGKGVLHETTWWHTKEIPFRTQIVRAIVRIAGRELQRSPMSAANIRAIHRCILERSWC